MNPLFYPLRIFFDRVGLNYRKKLSEYLSSLFPETGNVLDVGCDDGTMAILIKEKKPNLNINGIDIQENRECKIHKKLYDGKKIPYEDNSFDVVMSIDVLHHTNNIKFLLEEMKRVSKKYIILKDHIIDSRISKWGISIFDYLSNLPYGIKCTFNYLTEEEWIKYFNELGLKIVSRPSNLNFGLTDERYNPIFKLEI